MGNRFAVGGMALLGISLAGCAEQPTSVADVRAMPLDAVHASGPVIQSVRGSGHITVAGEMRTFTFHAVRRADGSVDGEFQVVARQVDRVSHGRITCMTVFGSSAWLGGVIERDNSGVSTGADALFRVVDLAQAPGGSPDLISLLQPAAPGAAQAYCNAAPPFPPLMPTESGEIVVTQPGSNSFTTSAIVPINIGVFVPCAANDAGEIVVLSGNLHTLFHVTEDGGGGFHLMSESNPQGVSGTGLTTGDTYQGTGVTRSDFNAHALPFNQTFVNNFRIIGQGPDNNLLIHHNMHVTVNANGEVTAVVDNFSSECR